MRTTLTIIVILLITTLFPVTALAAAPAEVQVDVRNQTAGMVQLSLTDAIGNITFKTLQPGTSSFQITEGVYTYYASTPCGALSGQWNLNVNKTLYLVCKESHLGASLQKLINNRVCGNFGYYQHYIDDPTREDNFISWTNQSGMILDTASWFNGSPLSTLEEAVGFFNSVHFEGATYRIGCYDNHTNILFLTP
jgi:hypothetical protein